MTQKIIVIVDTQNEFVDGVLGNERCVAAVPRIVEEIRSGKYARAILTVDTHAEDYLNTQEGKRLPVIHGQIGSEGIETNADIKLAITETFGTNYRIVHKNTFGSTDVGHVLREMVNDLTANGDDVEIVFVGFCTGICVISNVVIAKAMCSEQRVCVIADACACVTQESHETALAAMKTFQVDII